jgi:uncharacterized protein YjiS (DUF1127 family)
MDLMHRILRRIAAALEARAAIARLERLDDRLLADIGIERAEIAKAAHGAAVKALAGPAGRARPVHAADGGLATA